MLRPAKRHDTPFMRGLRGACAVAFALSAIGAVAPAGARTEVPAVEKHKNWSVHTPKNSPVRNCFSATSPVDTKATKDGIKRAAPYLIVATFPDQGVKQQVAVSLGYPASTKSPITLKVDDKTFKMFADGEEAWLSSESEDASAVAAMRAGSKAWVTATSTRGTTITDEYSLIGFTKATERAGELCS